MKSEDTPWSSDELDSVVKRYESRLRNHGVGEEALGWGKKGRQQLRFSVLASHWNLRGKRILDLGAGFGNFYAFTKQLNPREYIGIDLTHGLVAAGREKYGHEPGFTLKLGSATDESLFEHVDVTVISGLFNFRLNSGRNREFVSRALRLAFKYSNLRVACNFVTDHVDYRGSLMRYQSPCEALDIALSFTRNVTLQQDYMPSEYSVFLDRCEQFVPESAVFSHLNWSK